MPLEIERKFLVTHTAFLEGIKPVNIIQGYLHSDAEKTLRIRIAGNLAFLTIKGKSEGIVRPEYEYEIPLADAQEMMNLFCRGQHIIKKRFCLDYMGKAWTIDVFEGDNEGLIIAEIELDNPEEPIEIPPWAGPEVSNDIRYYNSQLMVRPFKFWS